MSDFPIVSPLPVVPDPADPPDEFAREAYLFTRALPQLGAEINAVSEFVTQASLNSTSISRHTSQLFTPAAGTTTLTLTAFFVLAANEIDVYRNGAWIHGINYDANTRVITLPTASQAGDNYIVLKRSGGGRGITNIDAIGDGVRISYSDGTTEDIAGVFTEPLDAAAASASDAETSASDSAAAALLAEAAQLAAESAEALAQKWAEHPVDTAVAAGQFSALHHATKAGQSAASAGAALAGAETARDEAEAIADSIQIPGAISRSRGSVSVATGSTWVTVDLATNEFADADAWSWNSTDKRFVPVESIAERVIAYVDCRWAADATGSYREARLIWADPGLTTEVVHVQLRSNGGSNTIVTNVGAKLFVPGPGWTARLQVRHDALTAINLQSAAVTIAYEKGRRGLDGALTLSGTNWREAINVAATTSTLVSSVVAFTPSTPLLVTRNGALLQFGVDYSVPADDTVSLAQPALAGDSFELILPVALPGNAGGFYNQGALAPGMKVWVGTATTSGGTVTVHPTHDNTSTGTPLFSSIVHAAASVERNTSTATEVPHAAPKSVSTATVVFNAVANGAAAPDDLTARVIIVGV
jgi:hypothetical protein